MFVSVLARIVVGLLLMTHGLAHYNLPTLWGSEPNHTSWLAGALGQSSMRLVGLVLWIITLLVFMTAGIVTFTNQPAWRTISVIGSALSLLIMFLFWDSKMIYGVAINIAVLVALIFLKWPMTNLIR